MVKGPSYQPPYTIQVFLSEICGARGRIFLLRTVFCPVSISGYIQGLRAMISILGLEVLRIF